MKVDAHSQIPKAFIKPMLKLIKDKSLWGRPTIVQAEDIFQKHAYCLEESTLGSSIANYRRASSRYVDSVFQGMYHKDVVDTVGYFDEKLTAYRR